MVTLRSLLNYYYYLSSAMVISRQRKSERLVRCLLLLSSQNCLWPIHFIGVKFTPPSPTGPVATSFSFEYIKTPTKRIRVVTNVFFSHVINITHTSLYYSLNSPLLCKRTFKSRCIDGLKNVRARVVRYKAGWRVERVVSSGWLSANRRRQAFNNSPVPTLSEHSAVSGSQGLLFKYVFSFIENFQKGFHTI